MGASGGIVTTWNPRTLRLLAASSGSFSLTTLLSLLADDTELAVTGVYAPCTDDLRPAFLAELVHLAAAHSGRPWIVYGDFNLTRDPTERNNGNFDAAAAASFNDAIEAALLHELPLSDRLFTWYSRRDDPTLVRLDRAFINAAWGSCLLTPA